MGGLADKTKNRTHIAVKATIEATVKALTAAKAAVAVVLPREGFEASEIKRAAQRLAEVVAGLTSDGLRNWRKANEDNQNRAIAGA